MALQVIALILFAAPFSLGLDNWDKYALVWQDEFDFLDMNKWQHEVTATGGGNSEFQLYSSEPTNSYVRDGKLFIKPTLLANTRNPQTGQPYGQDFMQFGTLNVWDNYGICTNEDNNGCFRTGAAGNIPAAMSARLRTFQKFSFTHGRVVISAKMPVGDWLWPAIWLLPENWEYGGWPRSGEIDMVEIIGNRDLVQNGQKIGIEKMGVAMHWGPAYDDNHYWLTNLHKTDGRTYGDNFHTYILDWSPNGLRFFIDDENQALMDVPYPLIDQNPGWVNMWEWGKPWKTSENPWASGSNLAPFDKAFHFIVNVAVGGTGGFIPDGAVNRGGDPNLQKPWNNGDGYLLGMQKFYNARGNWLWTWDSEGDNNAMQIDYIRVYQGP
jgi:hypothetical protein